MKKWLYLKTLALLILGCFLGCGGDDFRDNDGSIADSELDNDDQIPTITLEKIKTEKLEVGEKVWWRLKADPAPKTDLAVAVYGGSWVIIPKSKNDSEVFSNTFFSDGEIKIVPLPMVSIVGKGLVVDLELLQKYLPDESLGGHRIPKDFDFPVYNVGEPAQIVIFVIVKERLHMAPDGFVLAVEGVEVYRQFEGQQTGDLAVGIGEEIELNVVFLDASGAKVHIGEAEEAFSLELTGYDPAIIDIRLSEGEEKQAEKEHGQEDKWQFKVFGLKAGTTGINLQLLHGDHPDFTAPLPIPINVIVPDVTPPRVTGGTISDGAEDVDPEPINADGIEIIFSEDVAGNIALQTEDGEGVGWIGRVEGNRGMLAPVADREIGNETTYVIAGKVSDAAGNETEISITFTTAAAPFHIVVDKNLITVWLFEEGEGNVIFDSSGNGYHGRIDGDARWVKGKFGTALQFAGQGQGIVIENDIAFNLVESMTVTGWFYPNDTVTNRPLITKKDSFHVGFGPIGFLEFVIQPDDTTFFALFPFNKELRKWHHFAVVLDWRGTTFYINGRRNVWDGRVNNIPGPSEADLVIGAGFAGIVDEVAIYNVALTENEIIEIMENGFVH